ncbi:MAG: MoaD/ThiS family protein [Oceanicoccus sp.]
MVQILFFSLIREQLNTDKLSLSLPSPGITLQAFTEHLIDTHDAQWREVLTSANIIKAVNQRVVDDDCCLADGDEIAFFPPVTGG